MVKYPISVRRDYYRGNDKRKRQKTSEANADAAEMERVINEMLLKQTQPVRVYDWHEISKATGIPEDTVAALGYSIAGGSNGFTAYRHDLTQEKAIQMNELGLPTKGDA
ncbi:hypothetical protein [Herbaspirillum sp. B65]|uniref:hypothetical protein n=1 Tax=Herbaspirillum sp. B65 TaxID=137708 RepID=UPI0005C931BD|nr:hypothetical protein [Herbaspirillum sp. B65]